MDNPKSFEIVVRNKVPYLTNFLFRLLTICFVVFFLAYIFQLPARFTSSEMKLTYFNLTMPSLLKFALLYSTIGFIIIAPIYTYVRIYRNAVLTFFQDKIVITRKSLNEEILIRKITEIFCMDPKGFNGEPKQRLTLYFEYRKRKQLWVRLKNYNDTEDLMSELSKYEGLNIRFYDFETNMVSPDEK
jgi:hypothetical protein